MEQAWEDVGQLVRLRRQLMYFNIVLVTIFYVLSWSIMGITPAMAMIFSLSCTFVSMYSLLSVFRVSLCTPRQFYKNYLLPYLNENLEGDLAVGKVSHGFMSTRVEWSEGPTEFTLVVNFDPNVKPALVSLYRSDDDLPVTIPSLDRLDVLTRYVQAPRVHTEFQSMS